VHPTSSPTGSVSPDVQGLGYNPYCGSEFVALPPRDGAFWATTVFFIVTCIVAIGGAVVVIYHRDAPVFAVTNSAWLLAGLCVALVVCSLAVWLFSFGIFSPSRTLCAANDWVIFVSFYGVLLLLGYLFLSTTQKQIPWSTLVTVVCAVSFLVLLVLVLWTAMDKSEPDACKLYVCASSGSGGGAFLYVLLYFLLLVTIALVVAIFVLKIPFLGLNGNLLSVGVLLVTVVVWIIVQYAAINNSHGSVGYLVLMILTMVMTGIILFFAIFRKLFMLDMTKEQVDQLNGTPDAQNITGHDVESPKPTKSVEKLETGVIITPDIKWEGDNTWTPQFDTALQPDVENSPVHNQHIDMLEPDFLPPPAIMRTHARSQTANEFTSTVPATTPAHKRGHTVGYELNYDAHMLDEPEDGPSVEKSSIDPNKWMELGFLVGDEGDWQCYVHRSTGDPFWIHKETHEIRLEDPCV